MVSVEYAAGLFDGEGWFHISRSARKDIRRDYSYQVTLGLAVKHQVAIEAIHETFGGSIQLHRPKNPKHSFSWRWHAVGETVADFAKIVLPFLLIKTRQAMLAIEFQDLKRENKNRPCSDERHERLGSMYYRMKELNRRGPENTGDLETV